MFESTKTPTSNTTTKTDSAFTLLTAILKSPSIRLSAMFSDSGVTYKQPSKKETLEQLTDGLEDGSNIQCIRVTGLGGTVSNPVLRNAAKSPDLFVTTVSGEVYITISTKALRVTNTKSCFELHHSQMSNLLEQLKIYQSIALDESLPHIERMAHHFAQDKEKLTYSELFDNCGVILGLLLDSDKVGTFSNDVMRNQIVSEALIMSKGNSNIGCVKLLAEFGACVGYVNGELVGNYAVTQIITRSLKIYGYSFTAPASFKPPVTSLLEHTKCILSRGIHHTYMVADL